MKRKLIYLGVFILLFSLLLQWLHPDTILLEYLKTHLEGIEDFIQNNLFVSLGLYLLLYIVLLSFGMPLAAILGVVAGFFYNLSTAYVIVTAASLLSASLTFYIGNSLIYTYLIRRYQKPLQKLQRELDKNGFIYLLAIRISGIFPFFWINLLFGASNIKFKPYLLATFLGMLPVNFIYVQLGNSLATIDSFKDIFDPKIASVLIALAVLIILPTLYKHYKKRK